MSGLYSRWIDSWERRLAGRDTNRKVLPFDWGLDWLGETNGTIDPLAQAIAFSRAAVADSDKFFSYRAPTDFSLDGDTLTFSSPIASRHPENNRVHASYYPSSQSEGRAVVVLPQWNADAEGHAGLCRILSRFGISALRMSMAYHDHRMVRGESRADFHVSSNVGRTIHACRQSAVDARSCLDWLQSRGYRRLGILGTSLGSCIAFMVTAHDPRIRAGVFNHVSAYFSDVVWEGLATRYVRESFGQHLTRDQLRDCWRAISPATYVHRMRGRETASLLVWARHDTTFPPEFSKQFIAMMFETKGLVRAACLPCAHYTTGEFPFNWMDAFHMCRFLRRHL